MAPRAFVPPELTIGPFTRRTGLAAGLSPEQLRSRCWVRLFRDVYLHVAIPLTDKVRFEAARLALPPGAVATDRTAAWLFGLWTPRPGTPVPMEFGAPRERGAHSRAGVRSRRLTLDEGDVDLWNGVPVTTPERTCFGLMARANATESVVWADSFLHAGLVTRSGMTRYADERPRRPYVAHVRDALALSRPGAASPMETRLRLVVVVYGGLPEPPLLNEAVYDEKGNFLGKPDIGYLRPDFGLEYDGDYHRDPDQRAADNVRENGLVVANFPLLRYGAYDVYQRPDRIVAEVSAMLRRAA
ncbi:hypothetical protein [Sporichthya sp.]|uniref:hypothetical protein n=1 Tax=Sporichthya sp. TaxID=65475 RepID=UPI0017A93C1A|nr:hypothetical protein [Sporichthya sp.]MBA3741605.1 hypothetical protein [Sporichthya sp.]